MIHKPSRLLGHADVFSQLDRGNALLVGSNQIDGEKPLAKGNLGILEDSPYLDAKASAASGALVIAIILEVVNLRRPAVRAECTVTPTNRAKMVNTTLFVGEHFHHFNEGLELLNHGLASLTPP